MRMPDSDSTVFTAQTGPPTAYALLTIELYATGVEPPEDRGQDGRVTSVSRGMLTTVARVRPSSTWTTIAAADPARPLSPPPTWAFSLPLRESEPRTRMFSAPLGS